MEIVAESLLAFGVEKVWGLLVRESDRITGVEEHLHELKNDFELLMSFLEDADAKKHANKMVRSCVEQVREIAFDTEDIIETFLLKEELMKTSSFKQHMKRLSFNIVDRMKVALAMEGISKRISNVTKRMRSYDVQQMNTNGRRDVQRLEEKLREIRETFPSNNEDDLVGLEENVKELVGYLVEDNNIWVVSISGMGGIGKTTLAQQVANHEMVTNHFDGVAWVCLSQQFRKEDVWETIFKELSSKHGEQRDSNMSKNELQKKLFQLLESSNSLIVIDDIWKEEDWDIIKHAFPSKKGGKILLTSRKELVASHIDPKAEFSVILKPGCLSIENSWTLFQMTAFPSKETREYKVDEEMEEMGKKMIEHCGGLPLAIKVLGGLLATKYTLSEWERVFDNIKAHIIGGTSFKDQNLSSVYNILYLSFEELPIYLKHCFLYLAHFPEDYDIDVEQLSYLWAAEGIPRPRYYDRASIREVGDGYIEELVNRSMVISEKDVITSRFKTCRLHDMMREVCMLKVEEENFLQIVQSTSATYSKYLCKSRRVAVQGFKDTYVGQMTNPKLRSLLMISNGERVGLYVTSNLCFRRLQLMRVLDLSYSKFKGKKLPSSIGKLIHLRYLSLYMADGVSYLPSSMQNLKKLLYLNVSVFPSGWLWVPNFIKDMRELEYLSLPLKIHDKVKLELGNLVNLNTLEYFSTKNSNVTDLHQMTRLKRLSIDYNGKCTMKMISSSLNRLRHLENLYIVQFYEWVGPRNGEEEFVMDSVNLKQLEIRLDMLKFPLQHLPSHLTTIDLARCCLKEDPMPILEKLLQLKEVRLYEVSLCGSIMVCSKGGFPQLEMLLLDGIEEWEEWIVEEGSMPLLNTLAIWGCIKLKQLPDGMRFITSLKRLEIVGMGEDDDAWKEKLLEGGEDYYKIQHIPHRLIYYSLDEME